MGAITPSSPPSAAPSARRGRRANAPAGSEARKVGDYYATLHGRGGDRGEGHRAAPAQLDAIAAIKDARRRSPRRSARRCARTSTRSTHELRHAEPVRPVGRAGPRRSRRTYAPFLLQGGLEHAGSRVLPRRATDMVELRRSTRRTSPAMLDARRSIADADAQGRRASSRSRRRIAHAHATRVETEDVKNGQQPLDARRLATQARPASTGTRSSPARSLGEQHDVRGLAAEGDRPASPRW